ncbi:MAG: glucose-6-phosphate isomerase, partial [Spirochaetota bacterium]
MKQAGSAPGAWGFKGSGMANYTNFDRTETGKKLAALGKPPALATLLDASRVSSCEVPMGGGLSFNWAATPLDDPTLDLLAAFAREQELVAKLRLLASGEVMNTGEGRMVLHHLSRGELAGAVVKDGRNYRGFYEGERMRIAAFADRIRSGELRGSTGKAFTTVVQVGIGGSDLGPRALYLALERCERAAGRAKLAAR